MKKNLFALLGAIVVLTGCGSTPAASDASNNGGNSSSGDKTITFWHCLGHDKTRNLERIVNKFNEDHANTDGYKVEIEKIAGAYDDLHDTVKTKLQAGFVPSITMGYPDSFAEYIGNSGVEKSKILKLDDFIDNDSGFNKNDFVTAYFNEGTGYQYSGTWSVPLYKSTEVMYVNKEMFQGTEFYKNHKDDTYGDYGAVIGDPSTWDWSTLVYVASEVQKEKGGSNKEFHALGYDSDSNLFISQMAMRNIPYTSAEGTLAEHFKFVDSTTAKVNDKLVDLVSEIFDLTQSGALVTQGSYGSYSSDLFLQKKAMITIGSTGGSSYNDPKASTTAGFTCSLYAVPAYGEKSNAKYIMQGPSICFFNTNDPAKEAATWEFYSKYVSNSELNAALALENSYDPVRVSSYSTDSYKEWTAMGKTEDGKDNEEAQLCYRIPNLTPTLKDNYMTSPVFNGSAKARTEIGSLIKYAQSEAGTTTEKVEAAIMKAYVNCVNYIRGSSK